jgi:uncharacterized protein (TIGR02246 family)
LKATASDATVVGPPEDIEAIRQLFGAWKDAVAAQDIARLLSMVTDDAVFFTQGRDAIRRGEMEDVYRESFSLYELEQDFEFLELRVVGDWAFAIGRESARLTPSGGDAPIRTSGMAISLLTKTTEGWKFARGVNNLARV